MKLLEKIEKINSDINSLNKTIDGLINEQTTGNPVLDFLFRRKIRKWLMPDDEDGRSFRDGRSSLEDELSDWSDSGNKEGDIDDTIDDVKEKLGLDDKEKEEELRKMLMDIADKQEKLLDSLLKTKGFDEITVYFGDPIDFDIRRGPSKGEKLKLKGKKTFDVYEVKKKGRKSVITFNYQTKKENWLREKNILFSMSIKDPKPNEKYGDTTIKILYVNDNSLRKGDIDIIQEKVLTHKANVEIKSF